MVPVSKSGAREKEGGWGGGRVVVVVVGWGDCLPMCLGLEFSRMPPEGSVYIGWTQLLRTEPIFLAT